MPLKAGDLLKAGNTLTQRVIRSDTGEVTVKLDVSGMADGQQAGLCHLAKAWSTVGIAQSGTVRRVTLNVGGKVTQGPPLAGAAVWLRSTWGFEGKSQYAYSEDGKTFVPLGAEYPLTWSYYRGDRLGIYSYNDKAENGYVDVDFFHYTYQQSTSRPQ